MLDQLLKNKIWRILRLSSPRFNHFLLDMLRVPVPWGSPLDGAHLWSQLGSAADGPGSCCGKAKRRWYSGAGNLPGSLKPPWENLEWRFCCPRGKTGVWHTWGNILCSPAHWVIVQVPSELLSKSSFTHSWALLESKESLSLTNLEASGSHACPRHMQGFFNLSTYFTCVFLWSAFRVSRLCNQTTHEILRL